MDPEHLWWIWRFRHDLGPDTAVITFRRSVDAEAFLADVARHGLDGAVRRRRSLP